MQDSKIVRVELKYCECCGGLLLRPAGSGAIYCAGCAARVRELAPPRVSRRRGRVPASAEPQLDACSTGSEVLDEVYAVAAHASDVCRMTGEGMRLRLNCCAVPGALAGSVRLQDTRRTTA